MSDDDRVVQSLERAAELAGDLTAAVYDRWYDRSPESRAVMAHVDQHMQGRMLAEVFRLLMAPGIEDERGYLRFETRSHAAYGVTRAMYSPLLAALRDTVAGVLGREWTPAMDAAWRRRIESLLAEIVSAC